MLIAIDAYPLTADRPAGIGNYVSSLLGAMFARKSEHYFHLYSRRAAILPESPNVAIRSDARVHAKSGSLSNTLWLFTEGVRMMKREGAEAFIGTRQMLLPFSGKMKKLLVVYDLLWHYYPETMTAYNRMVLKFLGRRSIESADHIITISDSTAEAITEVTGVPRNRITVIYPAADSYVPLDKNTSASYISRKYGTHERYMLVVGTVEPRKNLISVLRARARLGSVGPQIIVCGSKGWKSSGLYHEYQRLHLSEDQVKFLGFVPDEDMNRLYSGALVLLMPSLYEGFAMPVLEAMSSGTPVVMTEACGVASLVREAALYVKPEDIDGWVEAMESFTRDDGYGDDLASKGLKLAQGITWKEAASKLHETLDMLV